MRYDGFKAGGAPHTTLAGHNLLRFRSKVPGFIIAVLKVEICVNTVTLFVSINLRLRVNTLRLSISVGQTQS